LELPTDSAQVAGFRVPASFVLCEGLIRGPSSSSRFRSGLLPCALHSLAHSLHPFRHIYVRMSSPGSSDFNTLGGLEVGVDISLFLLGVLLIQIYYYFEHFTNDRRRLKALVIVILVVEICHSIFIAHALYDITVQNYDITRGDLPWSLKLAVLAASFTDLIFECYSGFRIHIASRRWEFPILCCFIALFRFACNATAVVFTFVHAVSGLEMDQEWIILAPFVMGVILNFSIMIMLAFYNFYGGAGLPRNRPTIRRCLAFSVESGFVTWALILAMLVIAWTAPRSLLWISMHFIVAKTNSNAILITLNSRHLGVDTYNRNAFTRNRQSYRYPDSSPLDRMGNITVEQTQVTETINSTTFDHNSLYDRNEISLLDLPKDRKEFKKSPV